MSGAHDLQPKLIGDSAPSVIPTDLMTGAPSLETFDTLDAHSIETIGGKARSLVVMERAGLPVPESYFVTYRQYDEYLANGGEIDPNLVEEIVAAKASLGGRIALRSSANCEDGSDLSMAGVFETVFVEQDSDVAHAIATVYGQAHSEEVARFLQLHGRKADDIRMGLIVQERIEPQVAGVVYTDVNQGEILAQYVPGLGDKLVDGESVGSSMLIGDDGIITASSGYERLPVSDTLPSQLLKLAGDVRGLFGSDQDIEFAHDGQQLFVLQARPLTSELGRVELQDTPEDTLAATRQHIRDLSIQEQSEFGTTASIFCDANYSELLPRPTEMDIGIHRYVWGGSDGIPGSKQIGHKEMGYDVPPEATGMIQYVGGRTYFSLARNAALYHAGFPETTEEYFATMIPEYLETVAADPGRAAYPQMGLFLQDPTLEGLQQRFGDRAEEYFQAYQRFSTQLGVHAEGFISEFYEERSGEADAFLENIAATDLEGLDAAGLANHAETILEHIRTESYVSFVKAARLGFYYSQRLQTLLGRIPDIGPAEDVFSKLSQGLPDSAITDANLAIAEAPTFEEACYLAEKLVGHYSTEEMLEIRHPRLIDDPEKLAAYVQGIRSTGTYKADFERQQAERQTVEAELLARLDGPEKAEFAQVMRYAQTYMALRETAKYQFVREHLPLRQTLEALGSETGLQPDDIYFVYPRELTKLASNPEVMQHLIEARKQAFENYQALDMPSVIFDDKIDELGMIGDDADDFSRAVGKILAAGEPREGIVVNVADFEDAATAQQAIGRYAELGEVVILAARQMNLSHDPLIAQSAGLIIENAGIVAHGAQRARELGKGAIGGIRVAGLRTGMRVLFDPGERVVERLEE